MDCIASRQSAILFRTVDCFPIYRYPLVNEPEQGIESGLNGMLAQEVGPFGIKVTIVEPGAYATDFGKSARVCDVLEPYADFRMKFMERLANMDRGEPNATAEPILKLVDADNPPLRLALGSQVLPRARSLYADRIATWEAWKDVSDAAQGPPTKISLA
jgi:hypothetical protein